MRKFLDDLGVTERPDTILPNDERQAQWQKERDTYGFDERETWSLQHTFYLWLYERLKMYLRAASFNINGESFYIDLEYYHYVYNGNSYSQKQMIDMMIERLEFYFSDKYNEKKADEEQQKYVSEIEKLWAIVLPDMWW